MSKFRTETQEHYRWPKYPDYDPVKRPLPPLEGWQVIKRIEPEDCTPTCHEHWPNRVAYEAVSEKAKELEGQLDFIRGQLETLKAPEEKKCTSSFNEDYKPQGLTQYKYRVVIDSLEKSKVNKAVEKPLKDPTDFLSRPHPLPTTGKVNPIPMALTCHENIPARSEYEDTISKNALVMMVNTQRHRCPLGTPVVFRS